jgi:hypothetical protein
MEFEVEFQDGGSPADVEITMSGVPTPQAFARLNERLTSDDRFRAGLSVLVDVTALDVAPLSGDDVQTLSEPMVERDFSYMPSAVAIVAPDEETLDAVRAYRAHLGGSKSNRHLFTNRAEAVAWLLEQRRSDSS